MKELSIVTTLYKSERFIETFVSEMKKVLHQLKIENYELIFVNDGSPDDSLQKVLAMRTHDATIKIVDLSRNFGHHYAIQAGLTYASGNFVFLIDNDLETSPSFLTTCYTTLTGEVGLDVVYGYQEERKGKWIENMGGKIFWSILNKLSAIEIPKNILTERLMTRKYVDALLKLGDANLFMAGMMHWTGFNQKGLPVIKKLRKGESTYTSRKRFQLMIQAITSFSGKPLEYLFYIGILITLGSVLSIVGLIVQKMLFGETVQLGWTSLVAVNVLILGVISTFLGLIGIYLFKIFNQVQDRPNYIIKDIYE